LGVSCEKAKFIKKMQAKRIASDLLIIKNQFTFIKIIILNGQSFFILFNFFVPDFEKIIG